jgi:hypothetical protein
MKPPYFSLEINMDRIAAPPWRIEHPASPFQRPHPWSPIERSRLHLKKAQNSLPGRRRAFQVRRSRRHNLVSVVKSEARSQTADLTLVRLL